MRIRPWMVLLSLAGVALIAQAQVSGFPPTRSYSQAGTVNEFNASVSASSFELTTANTDRIGLACCNTGLATVTLRMSTSDAVLDQAGDKIFPGACWWDEPPVWTGEINAIGDQADGAIYCTEKEL